MTLDAHHIGATALLEVGCTIWSANRRQGDEPVGGVIVAEHNQLDESTGEIRHGYTVINPYEHQLRRAVRTVWVDEIDPGVTEPPYTSRIAGLTRRLAAEHAKSKGPVTHENLDWLTWAVTLTTAITGERR